MSKPSVLIIAPLADFNILHGILQERYEAGVALNLDMARSWLKLRLPDLILLDVSFSDFSADLKADGAPTQTIAIILLTANEEEEKKSWQLNVTDHLSKPFVPEKVLQRTGVHVSLHRAHIAEQAWNDQLEEKVRTRTHELDGMIRAAVFMLGEAGHYNDTDTGVHIWRMAAYAVALAKAAGWTAPECELLELAAPMHDTGKIGIPDAILKKPGKLDAGEWTIMMTHARIGHDILIKSETPLFRLAAEIALCHHEKWNGAGYPQQLQGEDIPESARIVAIADVFDALTMRRPYKEAWPVERAVAAIKEDADVHFEGRLVKLFEKTLPDILHIKERFAQGETTT